jgi:hypothetical protein
MFSSNTEEAVDSVSKGGRRDSEVLSDGMDEEVLRVLCKKFFRDL